MVIKSFTDGVASERERSASQLEKEYISVLEEQLANEENCRIAVAESAGQSKGFTQGREEHAQLDQQPHP